MRFVPALAAFPREFFLVAGLRNGFFLVNSLMFFVASVFSAFPIVVEDDLLPVLLFFFFSLRR